MWSMVHFSNNFQALLNAIKMNANEIEMPICYGKSTSKYSANFIHERVILIIETKP